MTPNDPTDDKEERIREFQRMELDPKRVVLVLTEKIENDGYGSAEWAVPDSEYFGTMVGMYGD
eukprot:m.491013 g.491013  ORF g.491013 m.491013 type:complete len:63 (+) comp102293_c0_seq1:298-486(+)